MRQFEVWWADLPSPIGRRPVLLLTRDGGYDYLNKVIVAELTTRIRGIPQELSFGRGEGLPQKCVANFDNVHVVPKRKLSERIGALANSRHHQAKRALGYALGWPELKVL